MNLRFFRDLSKLSDIELCRGLKKQPLMWGYFFTLTVIPFTLAWHGGTENLMPWQLSLIGSAVLLFLVLSLVGHKRFCNEITNRLNRTNNPNN